MRRGQSRVAAEVPEKGYCLLKGVKAIKKCIMQIWRENIPERGTITG